ncbi:hypothetical protein [Streptomyces sp. YGL11-2]|uniref:hypothetical protein n=1 Tax=Streptomyces sp. YGL11-2 TaxID=3414028 RepID=UPI003CF65873
MSETVWIPSSRGVEVRAFTNAWFRQYATLRFYYDGQSNPFDTWHLEGQGEGNKAMTGSQLNGCGIRWVAPHSQRYKIEVHTQYLKNGSRHDHQTMPVSSTLGLFNISMVLSEDDADKDWNDAVLQFTWWTPPK